MIFEVSPPQVEVPVESLRNLLDRIDMSEQPSTSRTVSSDTAAAEPPAATPTMFAGIPSVPANCQQQAGVQSGTTTWLVPISSSGLSSGTSYVETQQIDPMCLQRPIYPLSTVFPPCGGQYALSLFPPGEQPCGSLQQSSGQTGITSSGWVPILPQQSGVAYSMLPVHPVSNIPTTPAMANASQVQALPVVIQQPLVSAAQSQSQGSASLSGATQARTSTVTPHLGQSSSIGQQQMVQQPELVQSQQPPFQQSYQGPEQQVFVSNGQPCYNGYAHQLCQSCQHYAGLQRPIAQAIPSYPGYASPNLNQQLPFVATLELPDLNRLTNDPIAYALGGQ